MTPLSPSELVYLHADQFVKPRSSPISNSATVLSTNRNINRRSMVIEVLNTAVIANLTLERLKLERKPLETLRSSAAELEQFGAVGGFVSKMIGLVANNPKSHLSRVQATHPWQAGMLEALIFEAHDEAIAQPVQGTISRIFGETDPDGQVIQVLRETLAERGVIERRKRFFGETWTLKAGQVTAAQLESVKRMHLEFRRQQPEGSMQLERDVEFGVSQSDR